MFSSSGVCYPPHANRLAEVREKRNEGMERRGKVKGHGEEMHWLIFLSLLFFMLPTNMSGGGRQHIIKTRPFLCWVFSQHSRSLAKEGKWGRNMYQGHWLQLAWSLNLTAAANNSEYIMSSCKSVYEMRYRSPYRSVFSSQLSITEYILLPCWMQHYPNRKLQIGWVWKLKLITSKSRSSPPLQVTS